MFKNQNHHLLNPFVNSKSTYKSHSSQNPTMKTQKAGDSSLKTSQVKMLQEQFLILQQEWESYKKSNPKIKRRSFSSPSSITLIRTVDQLIANSPRHLMSSLQSITPLPKGEKWNIRTNDLAVEEIRRERRATIEEGKLKGRRLFEDEPEETEIGYGGEEGDWSSWDEWEQESEMTSLPICGYEKAEAEESKEIGVCVQRSVSSLCSEKKREEEKLVSLEKEEVVKIKGGNRINRVRCIVKIMALLIIAAIIFVVCNNRGLYGKGCERYEPILIPT